MIYLRNVFAGENDLTPKEGLIKTMSMIISSIIYRRCEQPDSHKPLRFKPVLLFFRGPLKNTTLTKPGIGLDRIYRGLRFVYQGL